MYTIEDIQIFIPTYNRPELLEKTIRSVLAQTLRPRQITVLDNGVFAETAEMVSRYRAHGVCLVNTSALGRFGNVLTAQQLANRSYVALFHDDDQLHPEYLEHVICALNAQAEPIMLISGDTVYQPINEPLVPISSIGRRGFVFDRRGFVTYIFNERRAFFSYAIYRTEAFKRHDIRCFFEMHDKACDVSFMTACIEEGKAIVFEGACGRYGVHEGQDTHDRSTFPDVRSRIEVEAFFLEEMGDNPRTFSGFSFCMMGLRHLVSSYKRRGRRTVSFYDYLKIARKKRILTKNVLAFRLVSNHLTQKLFINCAALYYRRSAKPLF